MADLAETELRSNRIAAAARVADEGREIATALGSAPLIARFEGALRRARASHPADDVWAPLTAREFEVARLVSEGLTNAKIGGELGVSPRTVAAHVEHILDKLGANRRAEIAAWAATIGATRGSGARRTS